MKEETVMQKQKGRGSRLSPDELSMLCEQLAMILGSGLPLHDGVEALCDNYKDTRFALGFEKLNEVVLNSGSLYTGVQAAGIFPHYMVEMTQIGEKTGELDTVMRQMAQYYEREAKIKRAMRSAITYPLVLVVMMAVLIVVLLVRVLPIFENVFRSMGVSADNTSNQWMAVGISVGKGVLIAAGVVILLVAVFALMVRGDKAHPAKSFVFRLISPLGRLNDKLCASRFSAALAMMLKSGYPLDESLTMIAGILNDPYITKKVEACRLKMEQGETFPQAVESIGIFDKLHCRMIRVGFQSGQTDTVMEKLAAVYEEEADDAITKVVSIIEPSLVALMSIIIGSILLSVMLPLLSMMSGIA